MNYRPANFEWLMLPLFAFTKSDRLFFLLNWIPYLLLPGLTFAVFRRLGIAPRVAWVWMWLLPAGYCYAMQAGGIGNDSFAAIYFLSALHFALRVQTSNRIQDVWWSVLSAALLTGTKVSNLPLLLPIAIALTPNLRLLRGAAFKTAMVFVLAAVVSVIPTAVLNLRITGHWTGDPQNTERIRLSNPVSGLIGNALELTVQNFAPPVLPGARKVEAWVSNHLPQNLKARLDRDFPRFQISLAELAQEEGAGLGVSLIVLLITSFVVALRMGNRRKDVTRTGTVRLGFSLGLLTWVAFLFYMALAGSEGTARLLAPYYPLLITPFLFAHGHQILVRKRGWNIFAICSAVTIIPVIVTTPSRPLFPTGVLNYVFRDVASPQIQRALTAFAVYARRNDVLAPLREPIPSSVRTVGLIAGISDTEISLWRPFGKRNVKHLVGEECLHPNTEWVVVKESALTGKNVRIDEWVASNGGEIVLKTNIVEFVRVGPEEWFLVRFKR